MISGQWLEQDFLLPTTVILDCRGTYSKGYYKKKMILYKTLTRLVILLYGCETRTILKAEEKRIKVLERRIFEKHLYSEGRTVLVDEI